MRGCNRAQASPDLTLFTPMNGEGTVYLMDLNGKIVHTWEMPYPPGLYGYLAERGTLFYNGKIPPIRFSDGRLSKAASHWRRTGDGRILWGRREANPHYDGSLLKNGNVRNGMLRDVAERFGAVSSRDSGWMVGITGINPHEQKTCSDLAVIASSRPPAVGPALSSVYRFRGARSGPRAPLGTCR